MNNWKTSQRIECQCDGEILEVTEGSKGVVLYDVMTTMPNGSRFILTRVPMATMFGGVGDNFQVRLRGTNDVEKFKNTKNDDDYIAATGDRVIISFLGGHIQRPIIVGFLPHPKETPQIDDPENSSPQASLNYLGVEMKVDETGQLQIIHRGAPEVKFVPGESLANLLSGIKKKNAAKGNPALVYPDESGITLMEFLDDGVWTVRDSEGQQILIDRTAGEILLTNSGKQSVDDLKKTRSLAGGEEVRLNFNDGLVKVRARKKIEIESDTDISITAKGNRTTEITGDDHLKISGDHEWQIAKTLISKIGGDSKVNVKGNSELTAGGDSKSTVTGDISFVATGKFEAKATGEMSLSGTQGAELKEAIASLTLKNGKIALKGASGEVLDIISKIIDAITKLTVGTALGPSSPPINVAEFIPLKVMIDTMKG